MIADQDPEEPYQPPAMDFFATLPLELVERILCSPLANATTGDESPSPDSSRPHHDYVLPSLRSSGRYLAPSDLSAFSATCRRHRQAVQESRRLWRDLFARCHPRLFRSLGGRSEDWRREFQDRRRCEASCRRRVAGMSALYFHKPDLSDSDFAPLAELEGEFGAECVMDSLRHLLYAEEDLTLQYYGRKAFRHLRFSGLCDRMRRCLQEPEEVAQYKQGMVVIAECFQPDAFVDPDVLVNFLGEVERDVKERLRLQHPQNPALKEEEDRHWTRRSQLEVLDCLNSALYGDRGFRGNTSQYYDPRNLLVDQVRIKLKHVLYTFVALLQ